jgi:hypothetical protein
MAVVVKDNTKKTLDNIMKVADLTVSAMATDVYRLSQQQVPVSAGGGTLQSSGIISKVGKLAYTIGYHTAYASYQHRGMRLDGSHVVKNYTYPAKKKHYISDPLQTVLKNIRSYIKRYAR